MPTDLNPEGVEAAAKAASEERFAAWTHPVFSAWEDEPEDLRESLRVEARAAIRAYQSTIHESSETLPPEMAEFVQRQRERLGVLPEGFHPAAVHASWLAIVDHLLAIIRSGGEGE